MIGVGREPEQFANEVRLADRVNFSQLSHSALPDHVHCLDALDGSPRTLKAAIDFCQPNSVFDGAVVLLITLLRYLHWRKAKWWE